MTEPEQTSLPSTQTPLVRRVAHWLVLVGGIIFGGAFIVGGALSMLMNTAVFEVALEHFAATVGLPSAAIAALCLVLFLESASGPIEFEGLGFKFKGASGPIVLWVFCFLAITAAIRLLW
jgi:hypothetical protein